CTTEQTSTHAITANTSGQEIITEQACAVNHQQLTVANHMLVQYVAPARHIDEMADQYEHNTQHNPSPIKTGEQWHDLRPIDLLKQPPDQAAGDDNLSASQPQAPM